MSNLFVKLQRLLPPSPVLVGTVIDINTDDDTSTVELPTNQGVNSYAAGIATGSRIRARGTFVPVGERAFVRDGVIESRAPDGDVVEMEVGSVAVQPAPLAVGTIPDQSATVGDPFSLDVALYCTGGVAPYGVALDSGALPPGATAGPSSIVGGTLTAAGAFPGIALRVRDSLGNSEVSAPFDFTVTAVVAPVHVPVLLTGSSAGDLLRTNDGGVTWTAVPIPTDWAQVLRVQRTSSGWIATGNHSDYGGTSRNIAYSANLSSWTQINDPTVNGPDYADPPGYAAIAASPSRVIAINFTPDSTRQSIRSDNDGASWTHASNGRAYSVEYYAAGGLFVRGSSDIHTSPDGITWTPRLAAPAGVGVAGIAISGGTLVAVPAFGWMSGTAYAWRSVDGTTWSAIAALPQRPTYHVASDGAGRFVACTVGGGVVYSADDGVTWAPGAAPAGATESGPVVWDGAEFLAVFRTGAAEWKAFTSPTGATWTQRSVIPSTGAFQALDYV